jgi:protein-tyrosine phosphatase
MSYVDLHSHVLPGLDDGPPDLASALPILAGLRDLGFGTVCPTPHQKADQFLPSAEAIAAAFAATSAALAAAHIELELRLGAESMWDAVFYDRVERDAVPCYQGSPAFLVEFELPDLPLALAEFLFRLRMAGKLPVIAHPERYPPLRDRRLCERLARDAALVVDLGAVGGSHGRALARAARGLLEDGLACAAASDAHALDDVAAAAAGIEWIRKRMGDRAVDRLLDSHPRRILAGELPEP